MNGYPDSTEDERSLALDVFRDALFPWSGVDILASHAKSMQSEQGRAARNELLEQEQLFADNVRRLMDERRINQEQLAAKVGVGQSAIANILGRKCRPQMRTVQKFADALEVAPSTLWPGFIHPGP